MFEFTDNEITIILEVIDFLQEFMYDPSDKESISATNRLENIANKLLLEKSRFSLGELKCLCDALDFFIHNSGKSSMVHISLLAKISSLYSDNLPQ